MNDSILPHLNAALNATSFILLVAAFYQIRSGNVGAHRKLMLSALAVSGLFLVSYVVYHARYGSVRFQGQGTTVRAIYFVILITHVVLAAGIVPLVIVTLRRALRGDFARHRRIARWTYPLWLYVSVTGVIVYLMLYHLYRPQ
jgi:putative membrane protein